MNSIELINLLKKIIPAHLPVLIEGQPGSGKTAIVSQAAVETGAEMVYISAALCDPTDAMGLPSIVGGQADYIPLAYLRQLIDADKLTVCLIDDIGLSEVAVQKSFLRLIHERRVGMRPVSPYVSFVAATNRVSDRAGAYDIISPLRSRFAATVTLEIDPDAWVAWAWGASLDETVIGFVKSRPQCLSDFNQWVGEGSYCCPRTAEGLSRLVRVGADSLPVVRGAIGAGRGLEYHAYRQIAAQIPAVAEFLLGRPMPQKLDEAIAVCSAVAAIAGADNAPDVCRLAGTLHEHRGELGVYMMSAILARGVDFEKTRAFDHYTKKWGKFLL